MKDLLLSASRSNANAGGKQTELKATKLSFGNRPLSESSNDIAAEANKERLDVSRSRFGFVPRSPLHPSAPPPPAAAAAIARPSPKKAPARKVESELDDALLDIEEELLVIGLLRPLSVMSPLLTFDLTTEKEKLENEISELLREGDLENENAEGSEEEEEQEAEEDLGSKDVMGSDRRGMLGATRNQ